MLKRRCSRFSSEEGSLILAMTVVLVVTLAITGVIVTVNGSLNSSRNDQNRTNAFQHANAGIDQTLFRLDRAQLPLVTSGNYTPTRCFPSACGTAGSFVTAFTDRIADVSSNFDVVAEAVPNGQTTTWKVRSIGLDPSQRQRQAITTLSATPLFVNGFLTLTNFFTNGDQTFPAGYDSSLCPDPRNNTGAGCDLTFGGTQPVPTRLGTNGLLQMATSTAEDYFKSWLGVDMWGRATQEAADADCTVGGQRCNSRADYPAGWTVPHTNQQIPVLPSFSDTGCPASGTFNNTSIPPGTYRCPQLNLSGTITVSAPGNVRFLVDGAVTINPGAIVNQGQPTTRFQVYQNPAGSIPAGSFCSSEFWGVLSAPRMEVDCSGSAQPIIYGAIIARFYNGTGSQFEFHWDSQSLYVVNDGKYVVRNWRECPATKTDC